jgi:starvation-inducible outer membrane lipoprotein
MVLIAGIVLSGCGSDRVFPPEAIEGADLNFDFARWRAMPNRMDATKVRLGGRILQAGTRDGIVTLVVAQMPIVEHPAYGPKDTGKSKGEFAITYHGSIESAFLQPGNRVMVIGRTHGPTVVSVDDLLKHLPTVVADCIHIWNTGGREISDFPSLGGGYEPLEQRTGCVTNS